MMNPPSSDPLRLDRAGDVTPNAPPAIQLWAAVLAQAIDDLALHLSNDHAVPPREQRAGRDALALLFSRRRQAQLAGLCDVLDLQLEAVRHALARQWGTSVTQLQQRAEQLPE
ncbi:hypothetical protein [Chitiniphilus shinanonensis]|nr:hypothetical protein [Chitiniphilus shinanonensis]